MEEINKLLKICFEVRTLLIENGITNLPAHFPIVPKTKDNPISNCQAYALCKHEDWKLIEHNVQVATKIFIHEVAIGLWDPKTNEIYPIERIIPTLLHEFAHCITPGTLVRKRNGADKNKTWMLDDHGDSFYKNFSSILEIAEKLKIYKLPPTFSTKDKTSLQKFDKLDVSGLFLGKCELYNPSPSLLSTNNNNIFKINLTVKNEKGEMKMILLEGENLWDELQESILKKFKIKKKTTMKIQKQNGDILDSNEILKEYLNSQNVILFRSK